MKTTKIFSVLSLALIFAGITAGFSKKVEPLSSKTTQGTSIKYQVSLHMDLSAIPCDTYLVQVVDETGRLVAPAQVFVPGVNGYAFFEKISTTVNQNSRRVAMLIEVKNPRHSACSVALFTIPAIKAGPFLSGHLYTFDLFPKTKSWTLD